jgi:transcriptional regulator with XRE-family HTH domain
MARLEDRIRQARRESGLSQEALAERVGVPPADLRGYEEGAEVSPGRLELIAVATGKPVSFFVDGAAPVVPGGAGVRGRVRAALAWLSAPEGGYYEEPLAIELAERERALDDRERRLEARERALERKTREPPG